MTDAARAQQVGRRGLLLAGGTAMAGGLVAGRMAPALAAPARPAGDGSARSRGVSGVSPITTTIASNPVSGVTYRFVDMYDFRPFASGTTVTWGGSGVYTSSASSPLRASVDIPPGARIADLEFYVYNNSAGNTVCSGYVYAPGSGVIWSIGGDVTIAPSSAGVQAAHVAPSQNGPYPFGARLLFSATTPTDGTIQLNGARVGFTSAGATTGVLAAPVRAYDSRTTGGRFAAGETRTITLPASLFPTGTNGMIADIVALGSTAAGYLKVYRGGIAEPAVSTLNYAAGQTIANATPIGVSAARQIKIKASSAVHVIVDVTAVEA